MANVCVRPLARTDPPADASTPLTGSANRVTGHSDRLASGTEGLAGPFSEMAVATSPLDASHRCPGRAFQQPWRCVASIGDATENLLICPVRLVIAPVRRVD